MIGRQTAVLMAIVASWPLVAQGQGLVPGGFQLTGSGGFGDLVNISEQDCRQMVEHVPAADVAYRPGVDVRGRPVAPADLGGGVAVALPEDRVVEIEVDLTGQYGSVGNVPGVLGKMTAGYVEVKNGRAYFNGQPLTPPDQEALAAACARYGAQR